MSYGSSLGAVLQAVAVARGVDMQVVLCIPQCGVCIAGWWCVVDGLRAALPYSPMPVLHTLAGEAAFRCNALRCALHLSPASRAVSIPVPIGGSGGSRSLRLALL